MKPALIRLLLALAVLSISPVAFALPCVTCRTEKCPDKPGLKDWCGASKDPHRAVHAKAATGKLDLLSEPPGASVFLDEESGEALGVTPLDGVKVEKGQHTLIFSREGYVSTTMQVEVQHHKQTVRVSLLPKTVAPPVVQTPARPVVDPKNTVPLQPAVVNPVPQPLSLTAAPQPHPVERTLVVQPQLLPAKRSPPPVYKRWWFWTAIGGGAAAIVLTGVLAAQPWAPANPPEIKDLRGKF